MIGIDKASIRNYKTIEFFDVIVTNPPFGSSHSGQSYRKLKTIKRIA